MRTRTLPVTAFLLLLITARLSAEDDRTLAPYFFVTSESGEEQFPLKATDVRVNVAGVIADVVVRQTYSNDGQTPIEAMYIFPASTRAAVYGMTMTIGEKKIRAVVQERNEAQQTYRKARSEGKSASLLEQHRANVFQMSVANIMPNDTVEVELRYTELLIPTDGMYEFVFPTVVGPRYTGHSPSSEPSGSTHWASTAHLSVGQRPTATFSLSAFIAAGVPLHNVLCPSHAVTVSRPSPSEADITLDGTETYGADRDFLLRYSLRGGAVETGLLLFDDGDEKFFLYMAQPPARLRPHQLPKREYVFIVDVSGSMYGFPLDVMKELIVGLLDGLEPEDRFNILFFSGGSNLLAERSLAVTPDNIFKARTMMSAQRGSGGTELLPALRRVLDMPQQEGYARTIVVATDGYVSVEAEAFDLIRTNLNKANLFAFGIGKSVNRLLIEGMARAGQGEPFIVTGGDEAYDKVRKFREYIAAPVLTKIRLDFDGLSTRDVVPIAPPDLFAQRPVIVFGKWYGEPAGKIRLRGTSGSGAFVSLQDVAAVQPDERNRALKYLWARSRIAWLGDFTTRRADEDASREIISLGLRYNLLTQYTSFVAVDDEVRNAGGEQLAVAQPLPIPQGVPSAAVGESGQALSKRGVTPQPQENSTPQGGTPEGNTVPQSRGSSTPQSSGSGGVRTRVVRSGGGSGGSYGGGYGMSDVNPLEPEMAPPRMYAGPVAGVSFVRHAQSGTTFDDIGIDETATGTGLYAGLSLEYLLGDVKDSRQSLSVTLSFASMPGTLSRTVETRLSDAPEAAPVAAVYGKDINMSQLRADILFRQMLGDTRLGLLAGPSLGLTLRGTQTERLTLSDEGLRFAGGDGRQYENDNRTLVNSGDIPGLRPLTLALKGGVIYEIWMRKMVVVPSLFYEYPLTSLSSGGGWKASALQIGLQIRFVM